MTYFCKPRVSTLARLTLGYFSLKTAERNRNPQKVHVNDLGLRQVASISLSMDYGKLAETLVYQHLQRKFRRDLFYWKGKQEIDFVIREGNSIHAAIQVAYENLDDIHTRQRELSSLQEIQSQFKGIEANLIVGKMPKSPDKPMMLLWLFLLT